MEHCDKVDGPGAEAHLLRALEEYGYRVACYGNDTQLVRVASVGQPRIQRWAERLRCRRCHISGLEGMPFTYVSHRRLVCRSCDNFHDVFGPAMTRWDPLPGLEAFAVIATDGVSAWGLTAGGSIFCHREGRWVRSKLEVRELRHIALSGGLTSELWGLDAYGQTLRCGAPFKGPWNTVEGPALEYVSLSCDGSAALGADAKGGVHLYSAHQRRWEPLPWDAATGAMSLSITQDASEIWAVDRHGEVYHRGGIRGEWTQVSGWLRNVAVSGDGRHVWGVNHLQEVWHRAGLDGEWGMIPALRLEQICASWHSSRVWHRAGLDGEWGMIPALRL